MSSNLPLAFSELLAGGLLLVMGYKGATAAEAINGQASAQPFPGASDSSSTSQDLASANTLGGGAAENGSGYTNPLPYVTQWERTDQGVDAQMTPGAPIVAPGRVRVLGIDPNWYQGQPFIYWQLLDGPDAGKVQYVAEQITDLPPVGSTLDPGQPIARYAQSGTGIEYGWATPSGQTLASATGGYTEGQITQAGREMRQWLNSVGAGAGS